MNKNRKTIIQPKLLKDVEEIFEYIKRDSPQNANKFKKETINRIDKVELNPTAYPPESNLNSKRKLYRFTLLMKSWKLIFKVTNELLIFLGIVHTSRHHTQIKKHRTRKYQ